MNTTDSIRHYQDAEQRTWKVEYAQKTATLTSLKGIEQWMNDEKVPTPPTNSSSSTG